jgi:predicted pyridoxine 5'-phosphate oxidase superfamily flavin-nucleotide-binding protein
MGVLTDDMKKVIREQRLGFFATVCPDGTPNLSPKGSIIALDDDHLAFVDLGSPGTLANLRQNPSMEVCLVDPFLRKGYRFKGETAILTEGPNFEQILAAYQGTAVEALISTVKSAVMMKVDRVLPLVSPGYLPGITEGAMRSQWEQHWDRVTESYHAQESQS